MENSAFNISLPKKPIITMEVTPGHFATGHAHTNYCLNMSDLKSSSLIARSVAQELALPYLTGTVVNTIVCMDKTEMIGAYLAEELLEFGTAIMDEEKDIHVITPMVIVNGKMIFQDNFKKKVSNKNIVLLVDSVSSGRTVNSALECLGYYGGILVGTSALFTAHSTETHPGMNALFTTEDLPDYQEYSPSDCAMCKEGRRIEAIINIDGYTKL